MSCSGPVHLAPSGLQNREGELQTEAVLSGFTKSWEMGMQQWGSFLTSKHPNFLTIADAHCVGTMIDHCSCSNRMESLNRVTNLPPSLKQEALETFVKAVTVFTKILSMATNQLQKSVQPNGFYKRQSENIRRLPRPLHLSPTTIKAFLHDLQVSEETQSFLHKITYFQKLMPKLKEQMEYCKANMKDSMETQATTPIRQSLKDISARLEIISSLMVSLPLRDPSKRLPTLKETQDLSRECKEYLEMSEESLAEHTAYITLHQDWKKWGTVCTVKMWPLFRAARSKLLVDLEEKPKKNPNKNLAEKPRAQPPTDTGATSNQLPENQEKSKSKASDKSSEKNTRKDTKTNSPIDPGKTSNKDTSFTQLKFFGELKAKRLIYNPVVSMGKDYLLLTTHFQKLCKDATQQKDPFDFVSAEYSSIQEQFDNVRTEVNTLSQEANDQEKQWLDAASVVISRDGEFMKAALCKAEIELKSCPKKETQRLKRRLKNHTTMAETYHKQLSGMVDHTVKMNYGETLKTFKEQKEHQAQQSLWVKAPVGLAGLTPEQHAAMKYPSSDEDE